MLPITKRSRLLRSFALVMFVPSWMPAGGSTNTPRRTLHYFVSYYCHQHSLSETWVRAIITVESNWRPNVVSDKGAAGLMQLMPGTARDLNVNNRFDSAANIEAGVEYLAGLLSRFKGDRLL